MTKKDPHRISYNLIRPTASPIKGCDNQTQTIDTTGFQSPFSPLGGEFGGEPNKLNLIHFNLSHFGNSLVIHKLNFIHA